MSRAIKVERLTQSRVRALLNYDEMTGSLTRLVTTSSNAKSGQIAGYTDISTGYVKLSIDGRQYLAHQIIWLWVTGEWPSFEIDHADISRANNRWSNLRLASKGQNAANASLRSTNSSGFKGVSWHKQYRKWEAYITKDGVRRCLGYTSSKEDAANLYKEAAREAFGEFARSR